MEVSLDPANCGIRRPHKFDRLRTVYVPISDETRLEIEAMQTEQERIEGAYPDAEEYPPDVDQRMAEIERRIDELNDQPRKYRAKKYRSLAQSCRSKITVR